MSFHCPASIYHRLTIFSFKCMLMRVIHLNKSVVTKRVLLSGGLKIQDGCQSWPLIAAKNYSYYINYFERNRTAISVTKPRLFHSWL